MDFFGGMTKDRNFGLLYGPKWPKNWTSEAHILHTSIIIFAMGMWSNTDVKPVKTFIENDQRPDCFTYFGPTIGLLRPIFHTSLKVLAMSMRNNDVKPVKTFSESDQREDFWLIWEPKWTKNLAFEADIVHFSESSSNEHIKQDWCEPSGNS